MVLLLKNWQAKNFLTQKNCQHKTCIFMKSENIIQFWFEEIDPSKWWENDPLFDKLIKDKFELILIQAKHSKLNDWHNTPTGRLAEIIVLDQFSRNIYRGTPQAFSHDAQALQLSIDAIKLGLDINLSVQKKLFMYMPFMHSESRTIHLQAVKLFEQLGIEQELSYELKHKKIIDKFGRYPHRNTILGRKSSKEEIEFLKLLDSSF